MLNKIKVVMIYKLWCRQIAMAMSGRGTFKHIPQTDVADVMNLHRQKTWQRYGIVGKLYLPNLITHAA